MKLPQQVLRESLYFLAGVIIGLAVLVGVAAAVFRGKVINGVRIAGIDVGGLTKNEASERVNEEINQSPLVLVYGESEWELIPESDIGYDVELAVEEAYSIGRSWDGRRYIDDLIAGRVNIEISPTGGYESLTEYVKQVVASVEIPVEPPTINYQDNEVIVSEGRDGVEIDQVRLRDDLGSHFRDIDRRRVDIVTREVSAKISDEKKQVIVERAINVRDDLLVVKYGESSFTLDSEELIGFLETLGDEVVSEERLGVYVDSLTESVNRPAQNARFSFENGRVTEFVAHRDGLVLLVPESVERLKDAILILVNDQSEMEIELAVETVAPNIAAGDVNDLGINELLGRAVSYYRGSIETRVYNVGLAASRLNGVLVPPGSEFSFNGTVGEVSAATGYKSAYIIQDGRTVLGDGGGVCQDSTTLFRAVMDAGLPITERWAHSYRVGYYEQNADPGFDATVYAPSKDFRFTNDTPAHILIQANAYPADRMLVIEIYGTSDGRESFISDGRIWDVTPPPPDLYQDDPSLPVGTVKQVDWSAWGAKTAFDYRVERDGEVIFSKTYSSNFRPWQNVFLVGVAGQ